AANLAKSDLRSPGALHFRFHGPAKPPALGGTARHFGFTNPQVVKTQRVALLQETSTGTDAATRIKRQYVPTVFIDAEFVAPIRQLTGLDCTVAEIDSSSKTMHFG